MDEVGRLTEIIRAVVRDFITPMTDICEACNKDCFKGLACPIQAVFEVAGKWENVKEYLEG